MEGDFGIIAFFSGGPGPRKFMGIMGNVWEILQISAKHETE